MSDVKRIEVGDRMSQAVVHNGTVTTAGQVALRAPGESVADQTRDILAKIDELLAAAGTSKEKAISAYIWLSDISTFNEMNEVWDAWVAKGEAPVRACVESKLAAPQFTVEIQVIAAV
ncbi:RidA family protein [Tepidamorphus sp. 3E244]|uniref:RidA family protein n=1 Tax=Tepidamorphus sp. 3E244 TaxID=3385498 RepID=UPI0038FC76C1